MLDRLLLNGKYACMVTDHCTALHALLISRTFFWEIHKIRKNKVNMEIHTYSNKAVLHATFLILFS